MKRHGPLLALAVVAAVLVAGLGLLFQWRLAHGDVFPAYSSLRADPLGTRALHDALGEIPGLRVERWHGRLADLEPAPPRTLLFAGWPVRDWTRVRREDFDALDAAIRGGSRVVLAMRAETAPELPKKEPPRPPRKQKDAAKKKTEPPVAYANLRTRWGATVKPRASVDQRAVAESEETMRGMGTPYGIPWRSDYIFDLSAEADLPAGESWQVIYRRGGQPVLVERRLGRGSLVLASDSYFLSNEALQKDRAPGLLAWIVGPHARVVFDETHLGVAAQPGVAALARRYGLAAAFFTLLLLAALFIWRRMAAFVPPADEYTGELPLSYQPAAGLEALLRRSVAPSELAAACRAEWAATARETDRAHVEHAMAAAKQTSAVALYNAAVRALKRR